MSEHYIITADHGHLRVYFERQSPGQHTPALEAVEAMDFPLGKAKYTERETDSAGRFAGSKSQSAAPGSPGTRTGMSIDERLPMEREESRRRAKEIAAQINAFFDRRPEATWDFAAGPDLNGAVVEELTSDVRRRIRKSLLKDLAQHPSHELRAHFAA